MSLAIALDSNMKKMKNFLGFAQAYIQKTNPVMTMYNDLMKGLKDFLTANKKLKVAQYRVNHLRYRMNQMEQLIGSHNPSELYSGKKMNLLR